MQIWKYLKKIKTFKIIGLKNASKFWNKNNKIIKFIFKTSLVKVKYLKMPIFISVKTKHIKFNNQFKYLFYLYINKETCIKT